MSVYPHRTDIESQGCYKCANEEYETVLPRTKVDGSLFGDQWGPALDDELSPVIWGS